MDFDAIYMICLRDLIRHFRDKVRLLSSLARPVLWLLIMGTGLRGSYSVPGVSYIHFIFPGIMAMNLIFAAMQSTISIIWDREFGFLKEILVAPISRLSIVLGKLFSGSLVAAIEGFCVLIFAPLVRVHLSFQAVLVLVPLAFLIAFACTSLGLVIAARMTSFEGFGVISNFIIMPLFFLSGAMFPVSKLPAWTNIIVRLNPLTYGVDLLRRATLGVKVFPLAVDLVYLIIFSLILLCVSVMEFHKEF